MAISVVACVITHNTAMFDNLRAMARFVTIVNSMKVVVLIADSTIFSSKVHIVLTSLYKHPWHCCLSPNPNVVDL